MTMTDFEERIDHLVASAAEFGYTREQVMAWKRADLIRFGDLLNARVQVEQATLPVLVDAARQIDPDGRTR